MTGATKDLISLAGKLDWQFNHGKDLVIAKKTLTQIKRKVSMIGKIIEENTKSEKRQS